MSNSRTINVDITKLGFSNTRDDWRKFLKSIVSGSIDKSSLISVLDSNELKQARIDFSDDNLSKIKWKLTALYFKKRNGRAVIMPVFEDEITDVDSSLNDLGFFLKDSDKQDGDKQNGYKHNNESQPWHSKNNQTYDSVASTSLNSTGVTKLSLRDLDSGSQNEIDRPTNKVIRSRKSSVGNLVSIFEKSQIFEQPKKPEIPQRIKPAIKPAIPTRPWEPSPQKPQKPENRPNPLFQPKPIISQKPLQFQQKQAELSTDIDSFFPTHTSTPRKLRQSISRKSTSNRDSISHRQSTSKRHPIPHRKSTPHRQSTSQRHSTSHRQSVTSRRSSIGHQSDANHSLGNIMKQSIRARQHEPMTSGLKGTPLKNKPIQRKSVRSSSRNSHSTSNRKQILEDHFRNRSPMPSHGNKNWMFVSSDSESGDKNWEDKNWDDKNWDSDIEEPSDLNRSFQNLVESISNFPAAFTWQLNEIVNVCKKW